MIVGHELLRRAVGAHDKRVLRRSRDLQVSELAVEQSRLEEMPVPGGEPGRVHVMTDIQEHEPCGRTPVQERIPVGALEGRARHDAGLARRGALVHPGGDRTQPGPPVVVGQRYSGGHLGDAGGGVKGIAVSEGPAKPACQQGADRRLAAARDTGHHHDHRVTPAVCSSSVDIAPGSAQGSCSGITHTGRSRGLLPGGILGRMGVSGRAAGRLIAGWSVMPGLRVFTWWLPSCSVWPERD